MNSDYGLKADLTQHTLMDRLSHNSNRQSRAFVQSWLEQNGTELRRCAATAANQQPLIATLTVTATKQLRQRNCCAEVLLPVVVFAARLSIGCHSTSRRALRPRHKEPQRVRRSSAWRWRFFYNNNSSYSNTTMTPTDNSFSLDSVPGRRRSCA